MHLVQSDTQGKQDFGCNATVFVVEYVITFINRLRRDGNGITILKLAQPESSTYAQIYKTNFWSISPGSHQNPKAWVVMSGLDHSFAISCLRVVVIGRQFFLDAAVLVVGAT